MLLCKEFSEYLNTSFVGFGDFALWFGAVLRLKLNKNNGISITVHSIIEQDKLAIQYYHIKQWTIWAKGKNIVESLIKKMMSLITNKQTSDH